MENQGTNAGQPVNFVHSTNEVVANQSLGEATSLVDYYSSGHCLVIGAAQQALSVAEQLSGLVSSATVVCIEPESEQLNKQLTESGIAVFTVPSLQLVGYLGAFVAIARHGPDNADTTDLAVSVYRQSGAFDTVLDLSVSQVLDALLPPLGYFHAGDADALASAIEMLPTLQGEFEKPKFFSYDGSICAHSRSELSGCNNCITVCATGAIRSDGEGIKVDPYLCQGCGSCATVCPSGAMSYAYPRPGDAINRTRSLLDKARSDDNRQHVLLMHTEADQELIDATDLHSTVLPLLVEEVSAFGIDYWASMICAGVQRIVLLTSFDENDPNRQALTTQMALLHNLLQGLSVNEPVVQLCEVADIADLQTVPAFNTSLTSVVPANFVTHNNKRQTLRMAVDTLAEQLPPVESVRTLNSDAPFGVIDVNKDACTLCMACVSVCPAKALLDGQDTPALRMVEANCVQCGLCEQACPESAITLQPRYNYNSIEARKIETLNEEEPFHCIRCQKAFATAKIIQSMFAKLDGHWMFKDDIAKRRLKMCDDCRVKDIFEHDAKGIDVHRSAERNDA